METQIRSLKREAEDSTSRAEDSMKRVDMLEKKLAALTKVAKESSDGRRTTETKDKEITELKRRIASVESENARLKDERNRLKKRHAAGGPEEGLDELEDEERQRLERRVRTWRVSYTMRRTVSGKTGGKRSKAKMKGGPSSPGGGFDDVDLSGSLSQGRRQSVAGAARSGFANVFSAFTGDQRHSRGKSTDLLQDDDDVEFDENAFAKAHQEEEKNRLERIKGNQARSERVERMAIRHCRRPHGRWRSW